MMGNLSGGIVVTAVCVGFPSFTQAKDLDFTLTGDYKLATSVDD